MTPQSHAVLNAYANLLAAAEWLLETIDYPFGVVNPAARDTLQRSVAKCLAAIYAPNPEGLDLAGQRTFEFPTPTPVKES